VVVDVRRVPFNLKWRRHEICPHVPVKVERGNATDDLNEPSASTVAENVLWEFDVSAEFDISAEFDVNTVKASQVQPRNYKKGM
jgi:hypothetical protein